MKFWIRSILSNLLPPPSPLHLLHLLWLSNIPRIVTEKGNHEVLGYMVRRLELFNISTYLLSKTPSI